MLGSSHPNCHESHDEAHLQLVSQGLASLLEANGNLSSQDLRSLLPSHDVMLLASLATSPRGIPLTEHGECSSHACIGPGRKVIVVSIRTGRKDSLAAAGSSVWPWL